MEKWVEAGRSGKSLEELFPIKVEPTKQHAEMLATRITFIRNKIIPTF
jgi:hypothetical protein